MGFFFIERIVIEGDKIMLPGSATFSILLLNIEVPIIYDIRYYQTNFVNSRTQCEFIH